MSMMTEKKKTAVDFAKALLPHLQGWTLRTDANAENWRHWSVIEGGKIALAINTSHHDGRLSIRGDYAETEGVKAYNTLRSGETLPSITVAMDRPPEKQAADIVRRLVPDVIAMTDRVNARVAAEKAYREGREAVRDMLIAVLPGARPGPRDVYKVWGKVGEWSVEAEPYSEDVKLELRVPPTVAVELLKSLSALAQT